MSKDKAPLCTCGRPMVKVLYMGIPGRYCTDEECGILEGRLINIATDFFFNGYFFQYEGSYFRALWYWLTFSGGMQDE